MLQRICLAILCAWAGHAIAQDAGVARQTRSETVIPSPSGRVAISLILPPTDPPAYRVTFDGKDVLGTSQLGLTLDGGGALKGLRFVQLTTATIDETYPLIAGKTSTGRDHCIQNTIRLEERDEPRRKVDVIVRAYDDAVAFRYTLPDQPGLADFAIESEDSTFALPADATAWCLSLKNFTTPYEVRYKVQKLADVPAGQLLGLPLLYHATSGPWVAITEANVTDYPGMYLTPAAGKPAGTFTSALSPLPGQTKLKMRGRAPHGSPWRVIMIGDEPGRLIESNVVTSLSEPCAIADTSWIKAGKVAFLWWNGYVVAAPDKVGPLNTDTLVRYIDFAADHHIPYASIDGDDHAWYGGPCGDYKGADVTVPVPELDVPAVFAHAKERGVRMRIWVNYNGLKRQIDKALKQYADWGAEGVMIDFIEHDDQDAVNTVRQMVAKCAELHMTVTLHNVCKPTGLERTYPNLRTSEAVLNDEYNKWDPLGASPQHELTVPFTRMLAGPLDFHQGGFRSVLPSEFKPRNIGPVVMGTRCHQMAMYVVYEDALPMIVDYPQAYEGQEGFDFICKVPTTWDETRVLDGEVGKRITIARRKGNEWYVGSMAGAEATQVTVPLSFLPKDQTFRADAWSDCAERGPNTPRHETKLFTASDTLSISMSTAGGNVVHLVPR